jgi:D-alanyl-D-alanine dipeptidase
MNPFDHDAYWRSTWRSSSARLARDVDRPRIAARVEIVMRRFGAAIGHDVYGRRFLLCAPALPDVPGDADMEFVLADAVGDLLVVHECERPATKAVTIHEQFPTALADDLTRTTSGHRNRDALARWIVGNDDGPPPG